MNSKLLFCLYCSKCTYNVHVFIYCIFTIVFILYMTYYAVYILLKIYLSFRHKIVKEFIVYMYMFILSLSCYQ